MEQPKWKLGRTDKNLLARNSKAETASQTIQHEVTIDTDRSLEWINSRHIFCYTRKYYIFAA